MSGMKGNVGGGRHVQDGHYFYAKLSEKRSQIMDVNERLRTEIDDMHTSRPRILQMMDKLQELTAEVKEMEAELQNYNLIVQKATAMASPADLQQSIGACQDEASQAEHRLRDLNKTRLRLEKQADGTNEEIAQMEAKLEERLGTLSAAEQQQYQDLQTEVRQLKAEAARMEEDAGTLNKDIHAAQTAVTKSNIKQQALQLQRSMQQLEKEKAAAVEEQQQLADPQGSIDALQRRMKQDTISLEAAKAQVKELQAAVKEREGEVVQLRSSTSASGDEHRAKYEALLAKEREVCDYLDNFSTMRQELLDKKSAQASAVTMLEEKISKLRQMAVGATPDKAKLQELESALEYKETQAKNSEETAARLEHELQMRRGELEKIDTLEEKLAAEMEAISSSSVKLQAELEEYKDLDKLYSDSRDREKHLQEQQRSLTERVDMLEALAAAKEKQIQAEASQIMAASWFQEYRRVEDQLRSVAGEAFHLSETIEDRRCSNNYRPLIADIEALVPAVNEKVLQAL